MKFGVIDKSFVNKSKDKIWLIGCFSPTIFKTDKFEFGIHKHPAKFVGISHYHLKTTELNILLYGKIRIGDKIFETGSYFIVEPKEVVSPEFLKETCLLVLRDGSFKNDKFEVDFEYKKPKKKIKK